jgi:hypothetical protein
VPLEQLSLQSETLARYDEIVTLRDQSYKRLAEKARAFNTCPANFYQSLRLNYDCFGGRIKIKDSLGGKKKFVEESRGFA